MPPMWNSAASRPATNAATTYHHHGVRSRSRYTGDSLLGGTASRVTFGLVTSGDEGSARPEQVTDASLRGRPAPAPVRVLVQRLDSELPLPAYALAGDAGADIVAAQDVTLEPGERAVLPTGLAIALPGGYAAF